jgi:hypothetical protein
MNDQATPKKIRKNKQLRVSYKAKRGKPQIRRLPRPASAFNIDAPGLLEQLGNQLLCLVSLRQSGDAGLAQDLEL